MRSRAAFISPQIVFAVPTLTCTITACARPVTRWAPCAMPMARFSCVARIGSGNGGAFDSSPRAYASTSGAKSVPALKNNRSIPRARSAER